MTVSPIEPITSKTEQIAHQVIGCAITVHRLLGPGFKEVIYERAFALELDSVGLQYEAEKRILVRYKGHDIPGHKVDLIVGGCVIAELKAVSKLRPIHTRQVASYLKATDLRLGLLINFNVNVLKHGLKRVVR